MKRGTLDAHTHTHGVCCVNMKTGIGMMLLEAQESHRWPENHQKLREGMEQILSHRFRRNQTCQHLDLTLLASRTLRL